MYCIFVSEKVFNKTGKITDHGRHSFYKIYTSVYSPINRSVLILKTLLINITY